MEGFIDLLDGDLGKTLISNVSQQLGQNEDKTASALTLALPLILGIMKNNAATPQGTEGLWGALSGKHDGSLLDNLGDLLGNSDILNDGAGILGPVFGGKQQKVAQAVGAKSGMDVASVMKLLQIAN